MSAAVLRCEHPGCGWERLAMTPKHDARVTREHAKTHEEGAS